MSLKLTYSRPGEGAIRVVQGKTGAKLTVPLHPELAEVLAAWPRSHQRILTTAFGKPFTPKGFGNWMADKIGQSGVASRCITQGLRKAAARRLVEAGCSVNEIAAITVTPRWRKSRATRRPLSREHWQGRPSAGWRTIDPSTESQTLSAVWENSEKSNEINVDFV
jgi:integrase